MDLAFYSGHVFGSNKKLNSRLKPEQRNGFNAIKKLADFTHD